LVGHDVGGMITYAYLREFPDALARAAILNVVIPGLDPWQTVTHNPQVWHFGFHAVPELPEKVVHGREGDYFAFFFDTIAATPNAIDTAAREVYREAYRRLDALHTGFEWYRAFSQDARDNSAPGARPVTIPVLYVRGDREGGDLTWPRTSGGSRQPDCMTSAAN
jgi:pimeloyl-ACP methyl ester carboxylesterase